MFSVTCADFKFRIDTALLLVRRQVHHEALDAFYRINEFRAVQKSCEDPDGDWSDGEYSFYYLDLALVRRIEMYAARERWFFGNVPVWPHYFNKPLI